LLLEGWLQKTANTAGYQVDGYPYSKEGIACMVPENNSKLLDRTNYALMSFMQGFVSNKPPSVSVFDKWFGPNSAVPLNQDLRNLVKESMQSILDLREEIPDSNL
jgi:polar amino acid transport system substrate-binding protein